jgi:hypothetical protein
MRLRMLIAAGLILVGGIVIARGVHYTTRHNVIDMGDVHVAMDEQRPVSPWIGGVLALVGLGLVVSSGSRRS